MDIKQLENCEAQMPTSFLEELYQSYIIALAMVRPEEEPICKKDFIKSFAVAFVPQSID